MSESSERHTGTGHGKIILFGEHAVVHGCPALAMALPRGATAVATHADSDRLRVEPFGTVIALDEPPPPANDPDHPHEEHLHRAFTEALSDAPAARPRLAVEVRLHGPTGAGLGASAAMSVAVLRAIDAALGRSRSADALIEASIAWEKVFHGNPSGVDSAMAACGGVALFRRGQPLSPVRVGAPPPLVVGYSGKAPSTKAMVGSVARQLERDPEKVRGMFDAIEAIVNNGKTALEDGNFDHLGQLMTLNQKLLSGLLLSTTHLEEMCQTANQAGALGAKLTGGGGGGCMIAIAPDFEAAERVRAALAAHDPSAFVVHSE